MPLLTTAVSSNSPELGLAGFILVVLQAISGIVAKYSRRPALATEDFNWHSSSTDHSNNTRSQLLSDGFPHSRSPLRYLHIVFGILVLTTLYVQLWTGYNEWAVASTAATYVPRGVRILYWVLIGIAVGGYIVGWLMEIRNRKKYGRDVNDGLMRQRPGQSMATDTSLVMRNSKREGEFGSPGLKAGSPRLAQAV